MFFLPFLLLFLYAASEQLVRTVAPYCPVDGDCVELPPPSDFWVLDPASFVHQGKAVPLESNLGFVKQESDTQFVFVLTNELHFKLTPNNNNRYNIQLISETLVAAESADLFAEELIRGYFLHENNTIELIPLDNTRTLIRAKDASIHLVAVSDFLKFAIQRATPQLMALDGEWITASPDKKNLLRLVIAREQKDTMFFSVEGNYNTYQMRTVVTGYDDSNVKHITTDPSFSTSLEADNSTLLAMEQNMVKLIELSDRMAVQVVPGRPGQVGQSSGAAVSAQSTGPATPVSTVVLKFWSTARPNLAITFTRPRFASKYNSFHQITPTKWEWMPSTYTGDLSVVSQTRQHEHVVLEVRQSGEAAAILDLYVGRGTHLRALIIRSARAGNPPLRSVYTEQRDERDDKFVVELLTRVLNDVTSIDLDPSGRYLSLVGEEHSMAFSSIGLPSAGVWVLDHKNTLINGQRAVAKSSVAHKIKLYIHQEGDILKGIIQGDVAASHIEFTLVNVAEYPSQQIIHVNNVARRSPDYIYAQVDQTITKFIKNGVSVHTRYNDEGFVSLHFNSENGELVFIHPLEFTAGLLGYWESADTGASLRLKPSGVGQLSGVVKFMDSRYRIRLSESAVDDSTGNTGIRTTTPTKWRVELRKMKAPEGGSVLHDIWREIADYEGAAGVANTNNPFDGFKGEISLNLKEKTVLEVSCVAGTYKFTRVLPPEVRARIEGDWFVEFVAMQDSAGTTQVGAVGTESMVRHVVTLQESGNDGSIVKYEGRVLQLPNRDLLYTFSLEVNPYGMLRLTNLVQAAATGVPETTPAPGETDLKLKQLLTSVLTSLAQPVNEETVHPWKIEAAPGELVMTDGGSILSLSRGLPTEPVTVPLLLLMTQIRSESLGGEEFTMIQYAQEAQISSRRRRLEGSPPSETLLSYRMIEDYRRRLMAADILDEAMQKTATFVS